MSLEFPEEDWTRLHKIRPHAIERLCKKALHTIAEISKEPHLSKHDAYLKVSDLVRQHDEALRHTFDEPRRSKAIGQIALMKTQELFTPSEFSGFTEITRQRVEKQLE